MVIAYFCVLSRNNNNPVMLALLLSYSVVLQTYVISTIRMMMQVEVRMVSADRCLNLLRIPQENTDGSLPLESFKMRNPGWPTQGQIHFNEVCLKYRPNTEVVLNNLSFKAEAGEKIGVVGRTGAGKSTICLSMSRIVEIISG